MQLKSLYEAIKELAAYLREELVSSVFATLSSCSIGVSVLGTDADTSTKLISHALQAMYDNYNESGNNINFYNNALHQKVSRRAGLEEIVRESIKNKTFMVYYQPIVSVSDWQVAKFEALCRFKDKNGDILNTQEMITITEDLGLISELDLCVAQQAIADRKRLSSYFNRQVEITINFSMNSEDSITKTFSKIFKMLRPYARDWPYITVELTESGYFDSEELAEGILYALRKKGIKVAIDDFGTGYSSFSYLKDGNFDLLKIDREFVRDISKNSPNFYIVKTIVALAHTLGVGVIAEGVETISEVTLLKTLNVDYIQGFLFSKPMPVDHTIPSIGYKKLIANINEVSPIRTNVKLVVPAPTVSNSDDLSVVKAIYETNKSNFVAVIDGKRCVGLIHKANYNLHVSPSVGTNIETTGDLRLLQKKTHQIMDSLLFRVNIKINHSELFEFIEQDQPFPWVVEDDKGAFIGLVTKTSALKTIALGS
ncbi:EAL domain-containing protein [Vibrio algarum]|uniref:GGDEF domain-containing phosphodiesterase n=1 Tax=Vibrio algarum TaxID=3020714 RepID=A0ABT4YR69_9VIBR|nr:GGDEF domain-containing phosphodiesterase [Vibrio sp. KJ40-1]MDB1123985.1 GGDEF domain-containing phosphodiesterase [Vibrio sp. KJ40-1]